MLSLQSCLTICNPMDCSPLGSSVHEIIPARLLEWVAISFSKGSSPTRDGTHVSCIVGGFFTTEPLGKPISRGLINSVSCPFLEGNESKRAIVYMKAEAQNVTMPARNRGK